MWLFLLASLFSRYSDLLHKDSLQCTGLEARFHYLVDMTVMTLTEKHQEALSERHEERPPLERMTHVRLHSILYESPPSSSPWAPCFFMSTHMTVEYYQPFVTGMTRTQRHRRPRLLHCYTRI